MKDLQKSTTSTPRPDIFVSCDPSYRHAGLCVLTKGTMYLTELCSDVDLVKTFKDCVVGSEEVSGKIANYVWRIIGSLYADVPYVNKKFLFEIPPMGGSYATGLFLLDGVIVDTMKRNEYEIVGCSCKLCKSVLGSQKMKKKDSVMFFNNYKKNIKVTMFLDKQGTTSVVKDSTNIKSDGIAEAFIMMATLAHAEGWGEEVFPRFKQFMAKPPEHFNFTQF